jgi:hypothetical protein
LHRCRPLKNDGKEAERGFVSYWTGRGHIQRLRDKKDLMAINGGRLVADFKKPSDFLISAPGVPLHYAEVKSCSGATSFPFSQIEDGQSSAAQQEYLKGSQSYIFYIFSYAKGQWYTMNCAQYAHQLKTGRRSIKFEELTPWVR